MNTFEISGKVLRYQGEGPWHFVYVNKELSQKIKDAAKNKKKVGFAFVRVRVTLGKTSWQTSLFPTKDGPYLLAIKAEVRRKEGIDEGDTATIHCALL